MKLFLRDRITLINELGSQDSYAPSVYSISHRACSPSRLVHFFVQRIFSLTNYLTPLQYCILRIQTSLAFLVSNLENMLVVLLCWLVLLQVLFVNLYNINYKKNERSSIVHSIKYSFFMAKNTVDSHLFHSICLTSESTP